MRNILPTLLAVLALYVSAKSPAFQVIPKPQQTEVTKGKGLKYNELKYIVAPDSVRMPVLGNLLDVLPRKQRAGKGIILEVTDKGVPASPEGYILTIDDDGAAIQSRGEAGLQYGCQTLQQLMEDSRDFGLTIPSMRITDWPAIDYRAVHLDTKHHLDRMEYYYAMMDRLARYKVNAVIWELEDKLRYERSPEIGAPNAISKQEMEALCRYAKERNIEISPLVQGLGHASFILKKHWELRENPQSDWEMCPMNPKTYEMLFGMYSDALEAMPYGKYLHIGGDEISSLGNDERCKASGKTPFELQMYWLGKVCEFARAHGRTPIFWDDMPLKYGGLWSTVLSDMSGAKLDSVWSTEKLDRAIDLFPKDCIYMRWLYGDATNPAHRRLMKWYGDKGLRVMGATAASAGDSPFMPRRNTRAENIRGFSRLVADNHLDGILATAWDDGSPHLETVWRGYIAQGEYGWNPEGRSVDDFVDAHGQREFGLPAGSGSMEFLRELEEAFFFFDGALVQSGRRNPAWGTTDFKLIELPDTNEPGAWSRKYADKITQAKTEAARFEKIEAGIRAAREESLRGRYTLDIYAQNNRLQNYPTRLLLALYAFDSAPDDAARDAAAGEIRRTVGSFNDMRQNLEKVYSVTRFMKQPPGYIEDMNHHNHLSAKSMGSEWLYYYELPMNRAVERWLDRMGR